MPTLAFAKGESRIWGGHCAEGWSLQNRGPLILNRRIVMGVDNVMDSVALVFYMVFDEKTSVYHARDQIMSICILQLNVKPSVRPLGSEKSVLEPYRGQ